MSMGKTRVRITPAQQSRWLEEFDRKEKIGNYEAFYRTQDITSSGVKAKFACPNIPGRVYQTLSFNETFTLVQLLHNPSIIDIKEQYAVKDLDKSKAFAEALEIKHPKHVWSSTYSTITWDFLCEREFSSKLAISVKPANLLKDKRTNEKLMLEKALAESVGYEHQIVTDKEVKTTEVDNIFRFLRGAKLPASLKLIYTEWLNQFLLLVENECKFEKLSESISTVAQLLSISYDASLLLMQHAFWIRDVSSDPNVPLYPEYSPYLLGVTQYA